MNESSTERQSPTTPAELAQAGERLKRAIHEARARTDIPSDIQLSVRARVHYDTMMNWFAGRTTPRPSVVANVADALGVPMADLMAAWDGREPDPQPLDEAIRDLIQEIRGAVVDERRARSELMRTIAASLAATIAPERPPVATMDVGRDREPAAVK